MAPHSELDHPRVSNGTWTDKPQSDPEFALSDLVELEAPPAPSLAHLIEATGTDFWQKLAEDESTPAPLLRELGRSPISELRQAAAGNDTLDEETRDLLSADEDPSVRAATVYWSGADAAWLARFDGDDDYDVVYALCGRSTIDPDQLRRLSEYEHAPLYEIARNPVAPYDLVEKLYDEGTPLTRRLALGHPLVTAELVEKAALDEASEVRQEAVAHRLVSLETLHRMRFDPDALVREALARSRRVDATIADTLRNDENAAVRRQIKYLDDRS